MLDPRNRRDHPVGDGKAEKRQPGNGDDDPERKRSPRRPLRLCRHRWASALPYLVTTVHVPPMTASHKIPNAQPPSTSVVQCTPR